MPASPLRPVARYLSRLQHAPASDADLLRQFADLHDADAFAELARRHGPMVLGVCRRILGDAHAAEDAFQATFLALARQTRAIRRPTALPAWLHGVAVRTARRARDRQRRGARAESLAQPTHAPTDPLAEVSGRELVGVIDEELARLPERYRLPLLLCGPDGLARDEAAARLGWSLGTLRGRLERGRELLRKRFEARGLALPAVLTVALAADATAAVPRALVAATSKAALAALTAPAAAVSLKALAAGAVVLVALGIGAGAASWERERPELVQAPVASAPASPQAPPPAAPRVDAEGVPLPPGVLLRIGSSRMRCAGALSAVVVAPDGKTVAAAGQDGVHVWETATGKSVCHFPVPAGSHERALALAFAGREIVGIMTDTGSQFLRASSAFVRFDPATGRERLRADLAEGPTSVATAAPSGRRFAYSPKDMSIRIGDAETGRDMRGITGVKARPRGLAFSPDDATIAVADSTDTITLYDAATGAKTRELRHDNAQFNSVTFSPDGRALAALTTGDRGEETHLWDMATRQYRVQLQRREAGRTEDYHFPSGGRVFTPDGKMLVTANVDVGPILWDAATGQEVRRFAGVKPSGLNGGTTLATISPDGKTLVAGTASGTVALWDLESGRLLPASADPVSGVEALRYADGGRRIIGRTVRFIAWNSATGREIGRYADVPAVRANTALSPDGRFLAGFDGTAMRLWDARTGQEIRTMSGKLNYFPAPVFTPDGSRLIATTADLIVVWDVATGQAVKTLSGQPSLPFQILVSPDGRWFASVFPDWVNTGDNTVRVWELTMYQQVHRFTPRRGRLFAAVFSPDGRQLATISGAPTIADDSGDLQLWDMETGREVRSFHGPTKTPVGVAFSADGRMLATSDYDSSLRLWEVASGGERHTFTGHAGYAASLAFAPDDRTLAAASNDAPVYVWDVLNLSEFAGRTPTAADLGHAWAALAGADAKAAFQAIRRLAAAPDAAVPFLRERLKPAAPADAQRVRELVRRLDNANFAERQRATQELEQLGDRAAPELRAALKDASSAEVRQTVQRLLDRIEAGTAETLRAQRAIEALEQIGTPAAREHLRALAGGAPGMALTDAAAAALRRRP